jgi:mRNA interferase HigB
VQTAKFERRRGIGLTYVLISCTYQAMKIKGLDILERFKKRHSSSRSALIAWVRIVESASWKNLSDLHADFPSADLVGACTVFNIGGNKYRLTALVSYTAQLVSINKVMTHAEYNRNKWKKDCEK